MISLLSLQVQYLVRELRFGHMVWPKNKQAEKQHNVISYITCSLPILQNYCFLHYQSMIEPPIKIMMAR